MARYNEKGQEILDQTPVALPAGLKRPPSLQERIRQFVRTELSRQAEEQGQESFEEADDFDIPDEEEGPLSRYELSPMQEEAGFGGDRDAQDVDKGKAATPLPTPPEKPAVEPVARPEAPPAGGASPPA